jgi:hypothetical protein
LTAGFAGTCVLGWLDVECVVASGARFTGMIVRARRFCNSSTGAPTIVCGVVATLRLLFFIGADTSVASQFGAVCDAVRSGDDASCRPRFRLAVVSTVPLIRANTAGGPALFFLVSSHAHTHTARTMGNDRNEFADVKDFVYIASFPLLKKKKCSAASSRIFFRPGISLGMRARRENTNRRKKKQPGKSGVRKNFQTF